MPDSIVKEAIVRTLKELEESGDLVVVSPIENAVTNKLFEAVQEVSPNLLSAAELGGIINALNAHNLGFSLDDNDFQTIIGLTKAELAVATSKLKVAEW
ncbi:hypothetical protein C7H09_07950 [Marinobacter fuscus]|uniref:Uncharacterized protein n=1 Tax=Marinobacter fuscus TaxID=2109942 RepID=A0A2T1KGJ7_9GAMM|nr:hypothetical protein [Marinobacter fuscus]PSF09257.1 hypothetical protein C7H09_07950 [Marinobacter fuscus]